MGSIPSFFYAYLSYCGAVVSGCLCALVFLVLRFVATAFWCEQVCLGDARADAIDGSSVASCRGDVSHDLVMNVEADGAGPEEHRA